MRSNGGLGWGGTNDGVGCTPEVRRECIEGGEEREGERRGRVHRGREREGECIEWGRERESA